MHGILLDVDIEEECLLGPPVSRVPKAKGGEAGGCTLVNVIRVLGGPPHVVVCEVVELGHEVWVRLLCLDVGPNRLER